MVWSPVDLLAELRFAANNRYTVALFQPDVKLSKAFWANHRQRIQGKCVMRVNPVIVFENRA